VLYTVFKPMADEWYNMLFLLSVLTMLIGNLFAIRQNNLKRFLAFSSIAQVGFILIGISGSSQAGTASVIYFVLIYIFSNLGAFGVVALVSALTGKEGIDDYKDFTKRIRCLPGFLHFHFFRLREFLRQQVSFGKVFSADGRCRKGNYLLITIAALNMIISLYYYLRVVKAMFMEDNERPIETLHVSILPKISLMMCLAGIVLIGFWSWIYDYIFFTFLTIILPE
jgi:NADH-quinone oxidoreductase subunit N